MKKIIQEFIDKLDEREVSEVDIYHILTFSHYDEKIIRELSNYVDHTKKTKVHLVSDLLGLIDKLSGKKSIDEDPVYKEDSVIPNTQEKIEEYTIDSLHSVTYVRKSPSDKLLNVNLDVTVTGELIVLFHNSKLNSFSAHLGFAYMDLLELENDTRESFRKIDLWRFDYEKVNYSFKPVIDKFINDIDDYNQILIWSSRSDTNAYLLPYYFINRFYDKIVDKEIMLVYVDELPGCNNLRELRLGQFDELLDTIKVLSKKEIDYYSKEWKKIASHKCEIRDLVNGKLEYHEVEDYFDKVKEILKRKGELSRPNLIGEMIAEKVLCGYILDIYSYIIDKMIEQNILSSRNFEVPMYIPIDKISLKKE